MRKTKVRRKSHKASAAKSNNKSKNAKSKQEKRISQQYMPDDLDIKTWQILLRKQAARDGIFGISAIDEENASGEYSVVNHHIRQEYKVVYPGARSP